MGSKQAILPFIVKHLSDLPFETALDAFSGTGCVAYAIKQLGKRVVANDFHRFAYHAAKATVQNSSTRVSTEDLAKLLRRNGRAGTFVRTKYAGLFFSERDCEFIDMVCANIAQLRSALKQSVALAALCRACTKKRPRGIFTFVGKKSWDGRLDLKKELRQHFVEAVHTLNAAVFSNGKRNGATCLDVFETNPSGIDLVYIDSPYVTPHSDCDYTRRYHFLEGLCTYWKDAHIQENTLTKKIASYPTAFKSARTASEAFRRLFSHFRNCIIVVSYGSNGIPRRDEMIALLREHKRNVCVKQISHKYSFGNHRHKVGNNNNDVREYLFIAT